MSETTMLGDLIEEALTVARFWLRTLDECDCPPETYPTGDTRTLHEPFCSRNLRLVADAFLAVLDDSRRAATAKETKLVSVVERHPWWSEMDPFDAACHIAGRLDSLLAGVEDEETLEECKEVAGKWMRDLRALCAYRDANRQPEGADAMSEYAIAHLADVANTLRDEWDARCGVCGGAAFPWLTDDETWAKVKPLLGRQQVCFECFAAAWFALGLNDGEPFHIGASFSHSRRGDE